MALSLSTLTSPATSGDVIQEINTTADFLEGVPLVKNNARGSQAGGSAKQDVALNQPRALPLIDGDGYLYLSGVTGNYASVPDAAALDVTGDITLECDFLLAEFPPTSDRVLVAKYNTTGSQRSYQLRIQSNGHLRVILSADGNYNGSFDKGQSFASVLTGRTRATVKVAWRQSDGRLQFFIKESNGSFTQVGPDQNISASGIYAGTNNLEIGSHDNGTQGAGDSVGVFGAKIYASINDTNKVLDVDFTATNVRNGASKFKCATNQVVTINTSGLDPAKIIKRPVLRFDGVNDFMDGLLNQTVTGGHMFAAFSVLGDGGESSGRMFGLHSTGGFDSDSLVVMQPGTTQNLRVTYNASNLGVSSAHFGLFDDALGDILHEVRFLAGEQQSKVNNADADNGTGAISGSISAEEFNLCSRESGDGNTAIDLEFLALFNPDSIPDDKTAKRIRNYINGRGVHPIFTLIDSAAFYFYDGTKSPVGAISSGSSAWSGRVVGSDNGDSASLLATQATSNDAPVGDGYLVTFADNSDHLEIPQVTLAAGDSYAWMVCGTSLGTFAYKVTVSGETELSLLGHVGNAFYNKVGSLYGLILLPENATISDIKSAQKLLIDRGSAESAVNTSYFTAWYQRNDIVEFQNIDMSQANNVQSAWSESSLVSFPALNISNCSSFINTWNSCNNLNNFGAIDARSGNNFASAWQNCSALTSFPAGAKLGTEATGVSFSSAWRSSGLTSFNTPLPTGTNFVAAWRDSGSLASFSSDLSSATNLNFAFKGCSSLTTFSTPIVVCSQLVQTWRSCSALTDFSPNLFDDWTPSIIYSGVFNLAWSLTTSLTAVSVGNILQSISASGQYATVDGNSGSAAIADAGIDIDYNAASGSLSAATNTAISSLKGRGWSIIVNNVTL
jgi:hypothetical protein